MSGSLSAQMKELVKGGARLGRRVLRPGVEGDITIGTTELFRVQYGDILLVSMYAEVVTAIGALVGVTTCKLQHDPTIGAASDISLVVADIAGAVAYTVYTWTGAIGAALVICEDGKDVPGLECPLILVPGVIGEVIATNSQTGSLDWVLHYIPLDTDSEVVVA